MEGNDRSRTDGGTRVHRPRAVIHKKILEAAGDDPTASTTAIAEEVSGASIELVERVLDEYGDPANATGEGGDPANATGDSSSAATSESGEPPATAEPATDPDGELRSDGATNGASLDGATGTDAESPSRTDGDTDGSAVSERAVDAGPVESVDVGPDGSVDTGPDGSADTGPNGSRDSGSEDVSPADFEDRQLAVLEAVAERPDATQGEIAETVGVSRGTVSRRLGKIDGFDWSDRVSFVRRVFGDVPGDETTDGGDETIDGGDETTDGGDERAGDSAAVAAAIADLSGTVDGLAADVTRLEGQIDDAGADAGVLSDPELAHKVVHACVDADYVSQEEELRIVRAILGGSDSR